MKERTVSIEELEKGMLIAADVHTDGGVVVVPQNTVVTTEVLNLLARHSIMEVSVKENNDGSVFSAEDMDVLHGALDMLDYLEERANRQETFEDTFKFAKMEVKAIFDRLIAGEDVDIYVLLEIVAMVVAKADNDVNLFHMLYQKMNQGTEDLYIHSINVSLYAQLLAKWVDLTADEVELAGLAGLLHDIGLLCRKEGEKNITLHGEYTNKCGKDHMVHSYNVVKDMDIDVRLKQAILTHHERMDLSGFPNRLSYKSLNYISRVVAIADAFATLTMKEPGFKAMQPLEALCYMFDRCYIKFDTEMLINFIEHVVRNFMQYEVLLSDAASGGKIVMANKKEPARPVVMVGDQIVDLAIRKDLSIKEMYY